MYICNKVCIQIQATAKCTSKFQLLVVKKEREIGRVPIHIHIYIYRIGIYILGTNRKRSGVAQELCLIHIPTTAAFLVKGLSVGILAS